MKYTKISVTLESDIEAELRRVAGARGVSSFVNEAVRQQLQATRLRRLLDQMPAVMAGRRGISSALRVLVNPAVGLVAAGLSSTNARSVRASNVTAPI